MDFRSLLQTMYTINEGETKETSKGREHKGTYGTSHGKEDVRDQYGHKIGKVNKDNAEKKSDAPKKRGRPTKAAKDETGADIKHDTSGIQAMLGKKPKGEVGKKSVKHSLKDWIESVETNTLNEDGQYVTKPIPQQATQLQQVIGPDGRPALNQPIPTSAALRVASALSSNDGSQEMAEGGEKWIQKAIKHPGALTKKAKAAGQSTQAFAKSHAHDKGKTGKQARLAQTLAKMHEAKDLPGNQEEIAKVAPPEDKIDAKDFKKLRDKKKIKESVINEGAVKALLDTLIADIDTATLKNRSPFNIKGLSPEIAKKRLLSVVQHDDRFENLPDDQQRSLVNLALEYLRDEGELDEAKKPLSMPDQFRQHADLTTSHNANVPVIAPTSFKTDPVQAVTDRGINAAHSMGKKASGFLKSLNPFSIKESTDMKDIQLENWEKELNSLLTEGITVSSSTGQQGSPDSVSINATDADAQELLAIVRQAGLGVFGGDKPQSDYGAPMHDNPEGHGTEPEMAPEVVGDDSDMLALIKKMTGIDMGGEEGSMDDGHGSDYEDEEGHDDTSLQPAGGEESEEGDEEVDEQQTATMKWGDSDEEPGPSGLRKMNPEPTVTYDPPNDDDEKSDDESEEISELRAEYPGGSTDFNTGEVKTTGSTNEDEMEEGNAFTGKLKQTPQGGSFKMGDKSYKDTSNIEEGHDEQCNECGYPMESCGCDHEEQVEEGYSNETGHEELAQLKALLSMGGDMHRPKHSQATGNIQKVTMETKLMKESSDLLVDFRKLSGIK